MFRDSYQFGSFDGADNRKELWILFHRLGDPAPEKVKRVKRAEFLRKLLSLSTNGFADKMARIEPCNASEAYFQFIALTGAFGVDVNAAAIMLEKEVSHGILLRS